MSEQKTDSDSEPGPVGFDADETAAQDDGDFKVGRADLGIDGGGDDFVDEENIDMGFDGVEDSGDDADHESSTGSGGSSGTSDGPQLEDAINQGLGRAAVYGLNEPDKSELETEFTEIAEAFHVGYFGNEIAEEYFSKDIEEIPPELGLAAASIAFAAVVIHKRPDGDLIVRRAKWKATEWKDEYMGGDEPEPEQARETPPDPTPDRTDDTEDVTYSKGSADESEQPANPNDNNPEEAA